MRRWLVQIAARPVPYVVVAAIGFHDVQRRPVTVSICIPAFRHERTIESCINSALAQTMHEIEVIVVDDCSPDATFARAKAIGDPRLRVERNRTNLGPVANHNLVMRAATGRFVQVLHGDDLLEPECTRMLAAALEENPSAGFAFSSRKVIVESEGLDQQFHRWLEVYGDLTSPLFPELSERPARSRLQGAEVLTRYIAKGFHGNWFGEPSCVLLRSAALRDVGYFNPDIAQDFDLELWLRVLCRWDAVFVNTPLSTRRVHAAMLSSANQRLTPWRLDRPWIAQSVIEAAGGGVTLGSLPAWRRKWVLRAAQETLAHRHDHGLAELLSLSRLFGRAIRVDGLRLARRLLALA